MFLGGLSKRLTPGKDFLSGIGTIKKQFKFAGIQPNPATHNAMIDLNGFVFQDDHWLGAYGAIHQRNLSNPPLLKQF